MRVARLVVCAALVALTGCVGSNPHAPPSTLRSEAGPTSRPWTAPTGIVTKLRPLVLRADLGERPARWTRVAFLPFGGTRPGLGFIPVGEHASVPIIPRSFALAPDGSIWILDVVKKRLAHFSADAYFLGDIGGFRMDRFHPHPRDVTFVGDRAVVAQELELAATITPIGEDGLLGSTRALDGGKPVAILSLYSSGQNLLGYVAGYSDREILGQGPKGYARLNLADPKLVSLLPGLPVGPGVWMDVVSAGDQEFDIEYVAAGTRTARPIRVRVTTPDGRSLRAEVGPGLEVGLKNALGIFVQLSPSRAADVSKYGGGRWYLRASNDGSALIWERLPDPGVSDTFQVRHLAVGPDGSVYLMVAEKDGMLILRR